MEAVGEAGGAGAPSEEGTEGVCARIAVSLRRPGVQPARGYARARVTPGDAVFLKRWRGVLRRCRRRCAP